MMRKSIIVSIVAILSLMAILSLRYTYKTAYICIYRIDNFTDKTYFSCQGDDWILIKDKPTAREYLNDQ